MACIPEDFPLGAKVRLRIGYEGIVVGYSDMFALVALPWENPFGWSAWVGHSNLEGISTNFNTQEFITKHRFWWSVPYNLQLIAVPVCGETQQTENYYDTHYRNCVLEPIKVMEKLFTPEEFKGFLKGCILKYRLRLGNKIGEDLDKELTKIQRYEQWLKEAEEGKEITV